MQKKIHGPKPLAYLHPHSKAAPTDDLTASQAFFDAEQNTKPRALWLTCSSGARAGQAAVARQLHGLGVVADRAAAPGPIDAHIVAVGRVEVLH